MEAEWRLRVAQERRRPPLRRRDGLELIDLALMLCRRGGISGSEGDGSARCWRRGEALGLGDTAPASGVARILPLVAVSAKAEGNRLEDGWHPARIIPTSGIGGGQEQERRATSALLAVMKAVPDFGAALAGKAGAPRGRLSTFVEVRFSGANGESLIPDGAIVVEGRKARWCCLVEVKTADNDLEPQQVDAYLDIARERELDAVLTISNQITRSPDESPVVLPTKGRGRPVVRPPLYHLSWWHVLTQAIVFHQHHGISDPDQAWILGELIAYLDNERSGASGFHDMGGRWVKARDGARQRTLRSSDPEAQDVAAHFEQFIEYLCLGLQQDLGRRVSLMTKKGAAPAERIAAAAETLAEDGRLDAVIRITDAVGPVGIDADLRGRMVTTTVDVDAPQEQGQRPKTRIMWMIKQLSGAPEDLRIEVFFQSTRGQTTSASLREAREDPERLLLPQDPKRLPRGFRLALTKEMGAQRGKGPGSFIHDSRRQVVDFYRDVVQGLAAWQPRAPRLPSEVKPTPEAPSEEPPDFSLDREREVGEGRDPYGAQGGDAAG